MDIRNATFDIARDDPKALFAFRETPRRVLLSAGDQLFRFTSLPDGSFAGNEIFGSPWWYAQTTFNAIVRAANRTGSSIVDAARSGLAVTTSWNPTMDWLVIIELTQPIYAFAGAARSQPVSGNDRSALFIGSLDQLYVPGLAAKDNPMSSDVATMFYYGSMTYV